MLSVNRSHELKTLEAESIKIFRDAASYERKPVPMYLIGKDSSVPLHLAKKALFPSVPPFPLLYIDTIWKFRDMFAHRARGLRVQE